MNVNSRSANRSTVLRLGYSAIIAALYFLLASACLAQVPNQMPIRREPDLRPAAEARPPTETRLPANPLETQVETQVERVRNATRGESNQICRAGLKDEIWVDVKNLNEWVAEVNRRARSARLPNREVRDLVPFFNGSPMNGVHPNYVKYDEEDHVSSLRFKLVRNKDSSEAWARIWEHPKFERRMGVSVGFPTGEEVPTLVVSDATDPRFQFDMLIVRKVRFWSGISLLLLAFGVFIWLARKTDIIRDTTGEKRPDNNWPYSLARTQMAVWFFLVSASFFFLWVLTGSMNTLTSSVLALIGISAGTALGAAMIDVSSPSSTRQSAGDLPRVNLARPRNEIVAELEKAIDQKNIELTQVKQQRAALTDNDKPALARNEAEVKRLTEIIKELENQKGYFSYPAWRGVMNDLLGEDNVITFHRFQMFVWTLLLAIIFVIHVYNDLSMPEFDGTLLGLLGISAGTYVGFKLPENKRENKKTGLP